MKKHIKPIIIAILLVLVACLPSSAQRLIRDFGIPEKDFVDTIKIKMWNGAIIVPVEIEGKTKNLMFDTGANMGFMSSAGLFGPSLDTVVNGELHVPEIEMGDLIFKDVWVKTATHKSLIGSAILEYTSLIIDAPKKSFVFLPHDGNHEITAANRGKGMHCIPSENGDTLGAVKVVVHKGTEGYEKGIRTGDYLISVDGTPIIDLCTYVLLRYNGKVKRHVFRSPEGEVKEIEW